MPVIDEPALREKLEKYTRELLYDPIATLPALPTSVVTFVMLMLQLVQLSTISPPENERVVLVTTFSIRTDESARVPKYAPETSELLF